MEMASAHGLALKLVEMNRLDRINRNELCEIISEEDKIIKLWYLACQSRFSKKDFFILMRKTILFVFSVSSLKEQKKKELLKGTSMFFNQFSNMLKNSSDIRKPFIDVIVDPWKNKHFSWEELFQKRINIRDQKVQQYFHAEPEEIVMARAHFFSNQNKDDMSMILAKNSFLFHSRILKSFKIPKPGSHSNISRKGIPSMDWYLHNLRRKKSLNAVYNELKQLTCHEGVLLIMRLRGLRLLPFALSVVQIFLLQELVHPSTFCCTKKLFTLWSLLHKEKETPMEEVNEEIRKMVAVFAPSSAHFYLLVDALWEQFGMSYVNIYVELYIRGLTSDLNLLEAAKHQGKHEDASYLESHISSIFYKLSTLFIDYHQRVARECMFSAFSLKPTKDRLYILQSMTHGILSGENEMNGDSSFNHNIASVQECKCEIKCTGFCKSVKEHVFDHPILMKGIPNIPYSVVKDLVGVLESVRCFRFQYNVFDWHKNATELGDYLRDFTLCKSYESDTECEEDSAPIVEQKSQPGKFSSDLFQPSSKRKSDSCELKEIFPFEIGANIEVVNEELQNKKMKMEDENENMTVVPKDILSTQARPSQKFSSTVGMEDAIENVIRATLDNNRQKLSLTLNKPHADFTNTSFGHVNDRPENLSSLYKPVSENHVYPYSLTNYGNEKNLKTFKEEECKIPFSSEVGNPPKYNYFPPTSSVLSRALTSPPVSRDSVISPTRHLLKNSNTLQEQSSREINQNKYLLKTMNNSYYNKSKDVKTDAINSEKNVSVYQESPNLAPKSSLYGPMRNVSSTVSQSSQYIGNQTTLQIAHRSSIASNYPKEQFLTSTPVRSTSSVTTPLNLSQTKLGTVQSSQCLPAAHHHASKASSVLRTDPRYSMMANSNVCKSAIKNVNESMCFQDNQLVYCDRSSVIQHTTQINDSNSQINLSEVEMPNQLSVSVNSDAAEQIRNNPKKNIQNLPPFKVNVSNRSISSSSLAVAANFVIARKPQPQIEVPSQPVSSNVTSDIITIPGILASPSVIVSPSWEAQRKVHGEMMYKKNSQVITASPIDKRIYKNRPPYVRSVPVKSMSKINTHDKNNNSQVHKPVGRPIVHAIPSTNQSNTNASQNWTTVNKLPSSQEASKTTSSQPWYTEPYPKPHSNKNVSSASSGNPPPIIEKSAQTTVKVFHPGTTESKSFTMYSQQTHQTMANPAVTTSLPHSTNNPVKLPTSPTNHNLANIKTYSNAHKNVKNCPTISPVQQSAPHLDSEYKNSNAYGTSNIIDSSLQFSHTSPGMHQNSCCSPTELNPCQNCSLPSENSLIQSSSEKTMSDHPNHLISNREKMILEKSLVSSACNYDFPYVKEDKYEQSHTSQLNCPHCSNLFSEIEFHNHILNCSSRNLDTKSSNLVNEIDSNVLVSDNFCAKTLTNIVPEQNSTFQKETFLNDLPQTNKSFINTDDDKNLEEIDANAFSTCMDLINNDKDLERIVQGISLDQIGNNYLPYMQPADPAENYLSNNLCNDIQNNDLSDVKPSLQNSEAYNKIDEINYINRKSPQLQEKKMSVFDFTDSKSVHQPIFIKPQISSTEKISPSTSKVSPELTTFSEIAEMIKGAMTENCSSEFESIEACLKNESDLDVDQGQPVDSTFPDDQNNFIHVTENVVQQNIPKLRQNAPKFKYSCPYCPKTYSSRLYVRRHTNKFHPGLPVEYNKVRKSPDISSSDMHDNNFKSKDLNNSDGNSYHNNIDSFNPVIDSDIKQNFSASCVLENGSILPKGKVKGIIKNPQTQCKFCGKTLTLIYMRKHILTQHKEIILKTENSSDLYADINQSLPVDSASPVDSMNVPSVSPLLEQDFDSSTCLSASDALKKNSSFTMTETPHHSEDSGKLAEKTNVKFNFDVLEFSKDAESDSKITSGGNPSLLLENLPLEHLKQEYPLLEHLQHENPLEHLQHENPLEHLQHENPLEHLQHEYPLGHFQQENSPLENLLQENPPVENLQLEDPSLKNLELEDSHLESVESFQEKNASHSKPAKDLKQTECCRLCNKSLRNLKRHLQNFHKISLTIYYNMNIQATEVDNSKNQENQLGSCTDFQKITNANIEPVCVAKETSVPISKESANFIPRTKSHDYALHSNAGRNLLKAVLQSNFSKNYKLSQKSSEKVNSIQDKQISIDETAKVLEEDSRLSSENMAATHGSLLENLHSSDSELKSTCEISSVMSVENPSDIHTAIKADECSYSFTSDSEINNELSLSINLPNPTLNDVSKLGINSDAKYSHVADSQNLSLQSCEISPVSQIISNVSRCHFGGTSNNANEKEAFEDNSLKLLIPENRDLCNSETNDESNKLHYIKNKVYTPNNMENNQDSTDSKLDLTCEKNDLDLCNQEIKQDLFQKKLSDSALSLDDSDVSTKKSQKITSLNCKELEVQNEFNDLENISQENQSYALQNSPLEKESYELENILQESKSCVHENSLENESSEPVNISQEKESCLLEDCSVNNESCVHENSLENESSEPVNISQEKESCLLEDCSVNNESCVHENSLENESSEPVNISQEKESCLLEDCSVNNESCVHENSVNNESSKPVNISQEKDSCVLEDCSVNNESCVIEDCSVNNECCGSINILENESLELKNTMSENESSEFENILENESSELKNTMSENESSEFENILENESSELKNTMSENESSEFENILRENESCNLESTIRENESSHFKDTVSKNKPHRPENILQKNKCNEIENIFTKNESCELEKGSDLNESQELTNSSEENSLQLKECPDFEDTSHKDEFFDLEQNILKNKDSLQESVSCEMKHASSKEEIIELGNTMSNQNNDIMCRLCQQNLDSMEILSKHLKDFHDIPVLKKHVSQHSSQKKTTHFQEIKLSPPKLKLGSNESDSESMSDFDCAQNSSRTTNDTSPVTLKKEKFSDKLVTTYPRKKHSIKGSKARNSLQVQALSSSNSSLSHQSIMILNKFKRHSFDDMYSVASLKQTDPNKEHLSFHLKDSFYKSGEKKSISLPNIKIVFPSVAHSHVECTVKRTTNPLIVKNIYVESSLSEDASFSSVNDSTENKSLYDSSSSSSSSQATAAPLNEITINSNFILPKKISRKKIILKSKLAGRKLIIQRLKSFRKRKSKSKRYSHKKIRTQNTFKPIILTLKEATEVDKFLETHKQPIVKLIRLKENEFDSSSNDKTCLIPRAKCDKINMEAIVKLEKIHIPRKFSEVADVGDKLFIPDLLQQESDKPCRNRKATPRSRKYYSNLRRKSSISSKVSETLNLSDDSIEISDESSDSVQFIKAVTKEEKQKMEPEICPTQVKKCFVVLNRLSI